MLKVKGYGGVLEHAPNPHHNRVRLHQFTIAGFFHPKRLLEVLPELMVLPPLEHI